MLGLVYPGTDTIDMYLGQNDGMKWVECEEKGSTFSILIHYRSCSA